MSQGVPGTPPPKLFLDTLARVSADPRNCGYAENVGERSLREAVVQEMKVAYGGADGNGEVDVTAEDVAITAGCNLAFFASAMAVAEKGDEVILPVPWYFNHEMTLTSLGIKIVTLQTSPERAFQPSPEDCERLITPKTKAIVLVTPNNPTGAIYPPSLIASFAKLAHAHKIALILDETYRDFLNSAHLPPHHLFSKSSVILPTDWSWRSTIIHLFSFSKSYCIPGHRVGLICASSSLIPQLNKALDNIQICAPRPPQLALASVLPQLRPFVKDVAGALERRHTLFKDSLPSRWKVGAQGGYYAFVQHPFKGVDAMVVCERLAKEMGVVCLPAGFFGPVGEGGERWVRFSVANVDDERVRLVCERLKESEETFGWEIES
ncbi:PLP-dependent transferase [Cristinia sonorae]|uniref:PLP-dependent transferase n=1 Tax=Cristinia sonorae TaxID=1940300 RepID=A0A8K0XLL9_9AGAR|nr:PLP-dependent transferase [Cristinia sonorae]